MLLFFICFLMHNQFWNRSKGCIQIKINNIEKNIQYNNYKIIFIVFSNIFKKSKKKNIHTCVKLENVQPLPPIYYTKYINNNIYVYVHIVYNTYIYAYICLFIPYYACNDIYGLITPT